MRLHPVSLALAVAAGIGWLGFPGLLWDVAWHRTIGRDSFLSPPHALMYAGVIVNGLVAGWVVLGGARRYGPEAFGRPWLGGGPGRVPAGFALVGLGFLLSVGGAGLDEAWHRWVGKDVNLWSPPHLVGLGGTMLIVIGLVLAVAAHTRYRARPGWRGLRLVLPLFFADLIHKSMVALDHYTLEPWGRTPDFYPFLLALLLPAILVTAARALGPGGATASAVAFSIEQAIILGVLRAADMRTSTLSPLPLLPALAVDGVAAAAGRHRALGALAAGLAAGLIVVVQESAWMAWVVDRPWERARVVAALPGVLLTGAGSAWVGWTLGGFVRAAAEDRDSAEAFGGRGTRRAVAVGMLALIALGLVAAYRPSRREPPATVQALGLQPDAGFDYRDAVFWDALLPDNWQEPGTHWTYQEGIIDGRPFPVGPAWCARNAATLEGEIPLVRFGLSINGEPVDLAAYPRVRRRLRDGRHCEWVGVSITRPRPGQQELIYRLDYEGSSPRAAQRAGRGATRIVIGLMVKEP